MYQSTEESDAVFDAWFANEADSRSRRHARRAARPVRDRVVLREDVVAANPAQARADKQAEVGHRLVSKTSCLALVAAVVTLLLIAVFALPAPPPATVVCEAPASVRDAEQVCQQNMCHYACREPLVHVGGSLTRSCRVSASGVSVWSGEPPRCGSRGTKGQQDAAGGQARVAWETLVMGTVTLSLAVLVVVCSLGRWLLHFKRQSMERNVALALAREKHRRYVGIFHSPNDNPLQGLHDEMHVMETSTPAAEHDIVHQASSTKMFQAIQDRQPAQVTLGTHGDFGEEGLVVDGPAALLADGPASQSTIGNAMRQSGRLRLVVLNACRAEPLANYLAATMPGVHVVCFTTLCADVTCRLFTQALHAVQRQMQEETGLTIDNENLNIVEMFTRAVMSAHSGGFSFGDPAPYIAVNHAEAAVRAMHDSSVDGVDGCLGCYPPVFGDVALKVGCETHTASQIVQEQLNLDGDVIAVGDEAFLE